MRTPVKPDTTSEAVSLRLAQLRERFIRRLAEDREALLLAWRQNDMAVLRERAHRLVGVSATFGFPEIGTAAARLESAVVRGAKPAELDAAAEQLTSLLSVNERGS
jgi:HPt (histidine-containing phosphotransfer) domain-containing protein